MNKVLINPLVSIVSVLAISSISSSVMAMEKGKAMSYDPDKLIYAGMFPIYSKGLKEANQECANNDGALLTKSETQSFADSGVLKDGPGSTAVVVKDGDKAVAFKVFPNPIPVLNNMRITWAELYCKPAKMNAPKTIQLKPSTTFAEAQAVCTDKGKNLLGSVDAENLGKKFANGLRQGRESLKYPPKKYQTIIVPYYQSKGNYGYRIIDKDNSSALEERNIAKPETRVYSGGVYATTEDIGPNHPVHDYFYSHTPSGKSRGFNPGAYVLISGCTK